MTNRVLVFSVLLAGFLLVFLLASRLALAVKGHIPTGADEPFYIEPALQFAERGRIAFPGLDEQLTSRGALGLKDSYFVSVPLQIYLRAALFKVFGTDLAGRRIADWVFTVALMGAFGWLIWRWVPTRSALLGFAAFAFHPILFWAHPGRPDLLAAAFGVIALGVATRRSSHGTEIEVPLSFSRAAITGFLVGLSGLSHQFGGVFWGTTLALSAVSLNVKRVALLRIVGWLAVFGLAGLASTLLWLPQILAYPAEWLAQTSTSVRLKAGLYRDFWESARVLLAHTLLWKPFLGLTLLVLPFTRATSRDERTLVNTLLFALLTLAIWRCANFEFYNPNYRVHFHALLCLLLAFLVERLWVSVKARLVHSLRPLAYVAALFALMLIGRTMNFRALLDGLFMPRSTQPAAIAEVLGKHLAPGDKILADNRSYHDVHSPQKTLMTWQDALHIPDFDAVVMTEMVAISETQDVYVDRFTVPQAEQLRTRFTLTETVPELIPNGVLFSTHSRLAQPGVMIFHRRP